MLHSFHDDAGAIGPVVMEALPNAARALGDVGIRGATVMHLEVRVRAVAKDLRAPRSEVDECGEELLGRRRRCLVQMDRRHAYSFETVVVDGSDTAAASAGSGAPFALPLVRRHDTLSP